MLPDNMSSCFLNAPVKHTNKQIEKARREKIITGVGGNVGVISLQWTKKQIIISAMIATITRTKQILPMKIMFTSDTFLNIHTCAHIRLVDRHANGQVDRQTNTQLQPA